MNTEFDTNRIDVAAIERKAHLLRAEAMRDGVLAIRGWLRARFGLTAARHA